MDYEYDVVIIGGGVVGCATLFILSQDGYKCLLVEKNPEILSEASSGNSGMLHTGFDAPINSKELHCIKLCQDEIFPLLDKWKVPDKRTGAIMVAWNEQQIRSRTYFYMRFFSQRRKLADIQKSSEDKGVVGDMYQLSASQVYEREPNLNQGVQGGIWIPNETVLDPWLFPVCMVQHSLHRNSKVKTDCKVTGITPEYNRTTVHTQHGAITCRVVVNCAGLYGDQIDNLVNCQTFSIKPRKGQYLVYGQNTSGLINSSILPVPTDKTKGIIVFKSVYNNVIVGPTAEDIPSRQVPPEADGIIRSKLYSATGSTVPCLSSYSNIGEYTGLRPATQYKDYQITTFPERNWISVGGIRSTGLSGCLGIGKYVRDEIREKLSLEPTFGPSSTIETLDWSFSQNHTVKFADSTEYKFVHPITTFGHQTHSSRL
ncbi:hypothetical protein LOTGIDRAFT_152500 [Lottia gigantea]|uniref:FAD dependent oxidoreductase domain-containing protein n=1 Tax=Lottia gigantea TaxID=225164 RepID=V4B556_LOTGI|nr:hypothetical protein LOTGIDRAFT_152500 [Lottia gigantea]ESP05638.1 hypothetical protein LOTGIDRAFT_152500 [Lottia gigantea]